MARPLSYPFDQLKHAGDAFIARPARRHARVVGFDEDTPTTAGTKARRYAAKHFDGDTISVTEVFQRGGLAYGFFFERIAKPQAVSEPPAMTRITDAGFVQKVASLEGGRYAALVSALDSMSDACARCAYFNPHFPIDDPNHLHYCRVLASCPAATLSDDVIKRIWAALDEMEAGKNAA